MCLAADQVVDKSQRYWFKNLLRNLNLLTPWNMGPTQNEGRVVVVTPETWCRGSMIKIEWMEILGYVRLQSAEGGFAKRTAGSVYPIYAMRLEVRIVDSRLKIADCKL